MDKSRRMPAFYNALDGFIYLNYQIRVRKINVELMFPYFRFTSSYYRFKVSIRK